jgi:hypothetical protein
VLVPRVAGLERVGAGVDAEHDVDDVLQLQIVHTRTHVDAIAGVVAHPLGRDAGERVVQELDRGTRPIAALRNVEFRMRRVVARQLRVVDHRALPASLDERTKLGTRYEIRATPDDS